MPKYEVIISEEINDVLMEISEAADVPIEEILQSQIERNIKTDKAEIAVNLYKEGKLKAREAWKLSGLDYQDFQNRARD